MAMPVTAASAATIARKSHRAPLPFGVIVADIQQPRLPGVTLFVPVLNEIDGMRAILPQIQPGWCNQILVVDGGSTDGSLEYARERGCDTYVQQRKGIRFAYMGRLDFFGIGPDSSREARTDFRLRETTGGVRGYVRPIPAIRLGGYAAIYSPQLGSGGSPALSSIEEIFLPVEVPALNDDPTFTRYRGFVEFYYPRAADSADEGYRATYQIAGEAFRDRDLNRYNFHRFETETKQRFRGFRPGQRLTVHGLMLQLLRSVLLELARNRHVLRPLEDLRIDHVRDDCLVLAGQVFVEQVDQLLS